MPSDKELDDESARQKQESKDVVEELPSAETIAAIPMEPEAPLPEETAEEAALAAAPAAGEEVIEAKVEEPEPVEGMAEPPVAAEAEGALELVQWQAKVARATQAIKAPKLGDSAGAGIRVRASGGAAAGRAAAARQSVAKEAEAVIPPPPKSPDPLPPPSEDPVPGASKLVRDASDKRLPNQKLPAPVATPRGNMPKVSRELAAEYATKVASESELAKAAEEAKGESAALGEKNPDKDRVAKIRTAASKRPAVEDRTGEGEPLVLVDEGPAPPAPMTKEAQTDVGKVLAVLTADPQAAAKEIVTDARRAAYPKGMLLEPNYNDFQDEVQPEVEKSLRTELDSIREQAGISKADLDRHVVERKQKLDGDVKQENTDLASASKDEAAKLNEEGQKTSDAIAGARDAVDENTERKVEAASGDTDPTVVKSKRERLIRGVARKVAQQSVAYTQAGERRDKALTDAQRAIETGYTLAARQDETQLFDEGKKAGKNEEDARNEAAAAARPSFVWLREKLGEIRTTFDGLKRDAKTAASALDAAVRGAGTSATEMIHAWAETKLGERRSFWEKLIALFKDWGIKAQEQSSAWEEARSAEARDAVVRDLDAMKMVRDLEARKIDGKLAMGMAGLTEEQRAVIQAYYEGPAKGDSIAAVAVGLRTRLSVQRRPELIQKFETKLLGLPDGRWKDVDLIAEVQRPGGFNAYKVASEVHGAVDQWGTDEDRIYKALSNLTPLRGAAARKCYRASGWGDMDKDIESELSGAELTRAEAQLSGNQALADAAALREAILRAGAPMKTRSCRCCAISRPTSSSGSSRPTRTSTASTSRPTSRTTSAATTSIAQTR